jgi:hypothetical protein
MLTASYETGSHLKITIDLLDVELVDSALLDITGGRPRASVLARVLGRFRQSALSDTQVKLRGGRISASGL